MAAPRELLTLVDRFHSQLDTYRSGAYNEAQTRVEFIDPMFKLLGWDVYNEAGYAEAYRDVRHEQGIKAEGGTEAPDYCFRIGGAPKFFLEAKKPSVNLKDDISPAFQLRRYAWTIKLPLSVLTDFEELAAYDCRSRPDRGDKASTARTLYIKYTEYGERWDEIAAIFSREAVLKGSFDRYAASTTAKRGTADVDDVFLDDIESWRDLLAHNIALRNPALSQRDLNYAVQALIDRIIFLRICEGRGIEDYGRLCALQNGGQVYARLCSLFQSADERYNSGLFHFRQEKGAHEPADELSLGLSVDDKPLKDIIKRLYYPDSPYAFAVMPADILGQVYEQFLGKVIRLTEGHRAVVEDKPEVKKAGGVYYTPTYIVEYIVEHTVGALLQGKTPKQAANLRILDPACGSGSFLIVAYQRLLDWHLQWYTANDPLHWAVGRSPALVQSPGGEWRLTTGERKRILLANIYGVDIDPQAVEVTKLSLLLKVLEGEMERSPDAPRRLFEERVLPDLSNNIKCGNSLIGPDFYDNQQMALLDVEERYRINVFDWQAEFPHVFRDGGFDVVIGNPPYIRIQALKEWAPVEVEFYKKEYAAAGKGNYDIYVVFVEKGLSLLNKQGRLGFILPHKFFNAQYGAPLRSLLSAGSHLSHVVHFGDQQVFAKATTYTCLMFLDKAGSDACEVVKVDDLAAWRTGEPADRGSVAAAAVEAAEWNFTIGKSAGLFEKLRAMPVKLGDVAHTYVGTQTSSDDVFVLDECSESDGSVVGTSASLQRQVRVEVGSVRPFLRGKQIRRYEPVATRSRLICPYEIRMDACRLLSEAELSTQFPAALAYLRENKQSLCARERGRFAGTNWFGFGYPKSMTLFQQPKIVVPDYNNAASYTFDASGHFFKTGYGIIAGEAGVAPEYLLALLNSTLIFRYLLTIGTTLRGGYVRFWSQYIEQLPIRTIDFTSPADVARHGQMVALVEGMLALHRQLAAVRTATDKTAIQRQIDATDSQIDRLVYELYGLTEEEIGIVEEGRWLANISCNAFGTTAARRCQARE